MTTSPERPTMSFGTRVVLWAIAGLLALVLVRWVFLAIFGIVKAAVVLALIAVLVVILLFGFGGRDDQD